MKINTSAETQLSYYLDHNFNPVPINVESQSGWLSQKAKRRNLYETHLGIPLSLLNGRDILEFGCNSGENALVLASVGANLTLVEPNHQVLPRLESLFAQFGLSDRISSLVSADIESFSGSRTYDLILAEGFLYNLPNRDLMLRKICDLLAPGGLGVISFADIYGSLMEMTKQAVLWRACYLSGVDDPRSEDCLNLARRLFEADFDQIAVSRPFDAWWEDALASPWTNNILWSYQEIIPLIQEAGCEFYSTSPKWNRIDHFNWYKNVQSPAERHRLLMEKWGYSFPYFLTGRTSLSPELRPPGSEVLKATLKLATEITEYTGPKVSAAAVPTYPAALYDYLDQFEDTYITQFNSEMKATYEAAAGESLDKLVSMYHRCSVLRESWGTTGHYLCFIKSA